MSPYFHCALCAIVFTPSHTPHTPPPTHTPVSPTPPPPTHLATHLHPSLVVHSPHSILTYIVPDSSPHPSCAGLPWVGCYILTHTGAAHTYPSPLLLFTWFPLFVWCCCPHPHAPPPPHPTAGFTLPAALCLALWVCCIQCLLRPGCLPVPVVPIFCHASFLPSHYYILLPFCPFLGGRRWVLYGPSY